MFKVILTVLVINQVTSQISTTTRHSKGLVRMVKLITGLFTDEFEFSHSVSADVGTWEASSYLQISHIISEKPPSGMTGSLTDEIAHRQLQPLALPNVEDEVHTVRRPLPIMFLLSVS